MENMNIINIDKDAITQLEQNNQSNLSDNTPIKVDVKIEEGTSLDMVEENATIYSVGTGELDRLLFTSEIIENLPNSLKEIVNILKTKEEKSLMLSTLLPVAATCLANVVGKYGGRKYYPNLYVMNIAPYGTGKSIQGFSGNLLREIVEQLAMEQKELDKQYEKDLAGYEEAKKSGEECNKPSKPPVLRIRVASNITKTLLVIRAADNPHGIIIIEVEGDTIVTANKMDSNNYLDLLRAAFGNETISVERKGDELSLMVENPKISLLASMTPNQYFRLIPDPENGLSSRTILNYTPASGVFEDMFDDDRANYEENMDAKGKLMLGIFNQLRSRGTDNPVRVKLGNETQRQRFREIFQQYKTEHMDNISFDQAGMINRLGLIGFKVLMILSVFRSHDNNFGEIEDIIYTTDQDFENMLAIVEIFRRNSLFVQDMMPKAKDSASASDLTEKLMEKAEKIREAKELFSKGLSYAEIAVQVLGKATLKPTIFKWLNYK